MQTLKRSQMGQLTGQSYHGYNKALVDRIVSSELTVEKVVEALEWVGVDKNGGEDYQLEEAYLGDVMARLVGE